MSNFARLEASYYLIDLMSCSLRRVLNLTYDWLVNMVGGTEDWDKNYAHIFDPLAAEDSDEVAIDTSGGSQLSFGI